MNWQRFVPELVRQRLAGRTKVQASLFYASSSLVCQATRFCGVIISTRLIDKTQFGFFAQAVLALTFASLLREIGQTTALLSYRGEDRRYAVFNFQISAVLGLMAAVLLWVALSLVPGIPAELRSVAPMLAVISLVETLTFNGMVMAQREFRFAMLGGVEIATMAAWLGTLAATATRMNGLLVLLTAQLVEVVFRFVAIFIASGWRYVGIARGDDVKRYYFSGFARHLVPQAILQTVAGRLDYLLLALFSTRDELGIYERMLQYIRIPWCLSINLIDRVILIAYSREQGDPAALRSTFRKSNAAIAASVFTVVVLATLAIAFGLKFLVGPEWADTILRHWWAALPFTLLVPFVWNLNIFCQGTGRAAQFLLNTVFLLFATAIFGSMAAPGHGAFGMLIAQGFSFAALLLFQIRGVRAALFGKPVSTGQND
jgi:O-antigen/teichoic acid export membrane protein